MEQGGMDWCLFALPRVKQLKGAKLGVEACPDIARWKFRVARRKNRRQSTFMLLKDQGNSDDVQSNDALRRSVGANGTGLLVRILRVIFKREVMERDAAALLCEYGRSALAEEGVARLDILREPMGPNPREFLILQVFKSIEAMYSHESTAHAGKLRTLLVGPVADSGLELYRTAKEFHTFRPLYPPTNGWISNLEGKKPPNQPQSLRDSLELLIENVGLEDVTIYLGSARARDIESVGKLQDIAVEHARNSVRNGSCIRTGVIVDVNDNCRVLVMEAYPVGSDLALFDTSLGDDYIGDEGWQVNKYFNVFPDCVGWAMPDDLAAKVTNKEEISQPQETIHSKTRIIFGAGCFESIGDRLKEMGRRVFVVTGWNQARMDPLAWEIDRFIQRGELELVGTHCITSSPPPIEEIFLGVERALRRKADMIVGYGGGSTLDAAKAIAALFGDAECKPGWVHKKNRERSEMEAAYEGGEGFYVMRLQRASKPLALIPSRPGSGSEVSDRSVVSFEKGKPPVCFDFESETHTKLRLALIDPRIFSNKRVDWELAVVGGLIAMETCIEAFMSKSRGPISSGLAKEGIAQAAAATRAVIDSPQEIPPRNNIAAASLLCGLARENVGFG
mmetsp:Transcript_4532/g.9043  ORF Transcript_4532/g.9043 Transcript_4532/m.9043 type:complete len:620 (-) Transcript_4532:782-2641(-)